MQQNRYDNLDFYNKNKLPLVKMANGSKIPVEQWKNISLRNRPKETFSGFNWATKTGEMLPDGTFFCVVDVDKRNGGLETLNGLVIGYGSFPKTHLVETGDGLHFYFKSKTKLKNKLLGPGVEFYGSEHLLIGAGSIHPSGKVYKVINDEDILALPDWVGDFTEPVNEPKVNKSQNNSINEAIEKAHSDIKPEVIEGERNNWLTRQAGKLRHDGAERAQLINELMKLNTDKCRPPLPKTEVLAIVKSILKYEPEPKPKAEIIEPVQFKTGPKKHSHQPFQYSLAAVFAQSRGLVKEISETILKEAIRPYPQFALASALGILAGVAQGSFSLASLTDDRKAQGSLSLFQWVTSPPGSGKNAYLRAIDTYLSHVDFRLVSAKVGSSYGLRGGLYLYNSQTLIVDEFQDELNKLVNAGPYSQQILTDMKEFFNDLTVCRGTMTKGMRFPDVQLPRLSIFGAGTGSGFKEHLTKDLVGGGFLSRFLYWPYTELPEVNAGHQIGFEPVKSQIEVLKQIYYVGQTEAGAVSGFKDAQDELFKAGNKGNQPKPHQAQTSPLSLIPFDQDAKKLFGEYMHKLDCQYRRLVASDQGEVSISPASITARACQIALKVSALHALGDNRVVVNSQDATFAVSLVDLLSGELIRTVLENAGRTQYSEKSETVMRALAKFSEPVSRHDFLGFCHMPGGEVASILIDLETSGVILAFQGDKQVSLEGVKNLPRGIKFLLRKTDQ
jgi:hypothetical protein